MSWPQVTIRNVADVFTGFTPKTSQSAFFGGDVPFVTPSDLGSSSPIYSTSRTLTELGARQTRLFPKDSVLVCCIGSLGKMGIAGRDLTSNQQINAVVFNENLMIPRYGFHALSRLKPKLQAMAPATTVAIVSKSKFEALEIPLPPLDEQRRIAAILDQADALRRKRREALMELELLQQATFFDMIGNPVQNSKGWSQGAVLGDFADIVSGVTKGRKLAGKKTREVPYLAVANVQDRSLNLSAVKTIEATDEEIDRFRLQENDLILTEGGDPDKLGRGTLWHNEISECIHQNHIFRVRLKSDDLQPLFLNWLVGSKRGKQYFLRSAKQTTGIASINMTQLRGFPLLIPPIAVQTAFADRMANIDKLVEIGQGHLDRTGDLFVSLQHRAFRGEL